MLHMRWRLACMTLGDNMTIDNKIQPPIVQYDNGSLQSVHYPLFCKHQSRKMSWRDGQLEKKRKNCWIGDIKCSRAHHPNGPHPLPNSKIFEFMTFIKDFECFSLFIYVAQLHVEGIKLNGLDLGHNSVPSNTRILVAQKKWAELSLRQ